MALIKILQLVARLEPVPATAVGRRSTWTRAFGAVSVWIAIVLTGCQRQASPPIRDAIRTPGGLLDPDCLLSRGVANADQCLHAPSAVPSPVAAAPSALPAAPRISSPKVPGEAAPEFFVWEPESLDLDRICGKLDRSTCELVLSPDGASRPLRTQCLRELFINRDRTAAAKLGCGRFEGRTPAHPAAPRNSVCEHIRKWAIAHVLRWTTHCSKDSDCGYLRSPVLTCPNTVLGVNLRHPQKPLAHIEDDLREGERKYLACLAHRPWEYGLNPRSGDCEGSFPESAGCIKGSCAKWPTP